VDHLCQLASYRFSRFHNIMFTSFVTDERTKVRTDGRTNERTDRLRTLRLRLTVWHNKVSKLIHFLAHSEIVMLCVPTSHINFYDRCLLLILFTFDETPFTMINFKSISFAQHLSSYKCHLFVTKVVKLTVIIIRSVLSPTNYMNVVVIYTKKSFVPRSLFRYS